MTKEIVVSLYDKNLDWIKDLNSDIKTTIYKKGNKISHPNEIYLPNNVGRDVHTFFYHITKNYHNLSDYTFFSQDYPFDHIENYIELINGDEEIWDKYSNHHFQEYWGYHWNNIGTMWALLDSEQFGGKVLKCNSYGHPHDNNLDVDNAWNMFFSSPIPDHYEFTPGGHFSISKNQIYIRSLDFYKKVLLFLEEKDKAPWEIERLEPYIFNKDIQSHF
jgi:hypothetical protein